MARKHKSANGRTKRKAIESTPAHPGRMPNEFSREALYEAACLHEMRTKQTPRGQQHRAPQGQAVRPEEMALAHGRWVVRCAVNYALHNQQEKP